MLQNYPRNKCQVCGKSARTYALGSNREIYGACWECLNRDHYPNDFGCNVCELPNFRYHKLRFNYAQAREDSLNVFLLCSEACYHNMRKTLTSSRFSFLCAACHKPAQYSCARCNIPDYCSKECQRADWSRHKPACFRRLDIKYVFGEKGCYYCGKKTDGTVCDECKKYRQENAVCRICGEPPYIFEIYMLRDIPVAALICSSKCAKRLKHIARDLCQLKEVCRYCHKASKCKKCSRCMLVYYCSEECQKSHWPTHKETCKTDQEAKADGAAPDP